MIRSFLKSVAVAALTKAADSLKGPPAPIAPQAPYQGGSTVSQPAPTYAHDPIDAPNITPIAKPPAITTASPDAQVALSVEPHIIRHADSPVVFTMPTINLPSLDDADDDADGDSPDDFDDDAEWMPTIAPTLAVEDTAHEAILALGLVPIARGFFKAAAPIGKGAAINFTESEEVARDKDGNPIPLDDESVKEAIAAAHTKELSPISGSLLWDVPTQLPIIRSESKVIFAPAFSKRGQAMSWLGGSFSALDREFAAIGWVRYVAIGFGERDSNYEGSGTFWEGYVPLLKTAAKPKEALALALRLGLKPLGNPSACVKAGVNFGNAGRAWILLRVATWLAPRLTEMGLARDSQ